MSSPPTTSQAYGGTKEWDAAKVYTRPAANEGKLDDGNDNANTDANINADTKADTKVNTQELRVDPSDGNAYNKAEFIEVLRLWVGRLL